MIDVIVEAAQVQRIKLPDMIWLCISSTTNSVSLATGEEAARKWAAAETGRYLCSVAVPADTVIYGVEQVPATTRLKQVRP